MDSCSTIFLILVVVTVVVLVAAFMSGQAEAARVAEMPETERQAYLEAKRASAVELVRGPKNPAMVCPHCQAKGVVRTKSVKQKRGVSGTKATAALLTGGVSLLATGLSRKESLTEAYCENCKSIWHF